MEARFMSCLVMVWIVMYHLIAVMVMVEAGNVSYVQTVLTGNNNFETTVHCRREQVEFTDMLTISPTLSNVGMLQDFLRETYCEYRHADWVEKCLESMQSMIANALDHAQKEQFQAKSYYSTMTLTDDGFFQRLAEPILTTEEGSRFRGGDLAVLVSGFWDVSVSKYSNESLTESNEQANSVAKNESRATKGKYWDWFQYSLAMDMPLVFFCDSKNISAFQQFRGTRPTLYVDSNLNDFEISYSRYPSHWIHPMHVPSADLARIWLQKMRLTRLADVLVSADHIEFFVWVDAGMSSLRTTPPPPGEWSTDVLMSLPRHRVSYCAVLDTYHNTAAGVMIFPRRIIMIISLIFYHEFHKCTQTIADWRCGSEQYLFSQMRQLYPNLFHSACYDYGQIHWLWGARGTLS